MRRVCITVVALVAALVGADGRPDDVQDEFRASQGTWDLVYFERDGKQVKLQGRTQAIITGETFVVKRGDEIIAAGTSKLDPSKEPKTLDSTYTQGSDKGKTLKGIYQVDGDTMKFCRPGSPDDARPTEFKTTPGSGAFVSVYKRALADDVLSRFVGTWKIRTTAKPAKWAPEGAEFAGQESTVRALKNRLILIRDMSQPDGRKGLWIATYDTEQKAYPFLGFDSTGLMGAQWRLTWDVASNSAVGRATDLPDGWTSGGKNQFPDRDTNLVSVWIKDENGDLLMDHDGKKSRRPDADAPAIVAAWMNSEPAADRPKELEVLDRMIGTWDTVSMMKPAEWTPDGGRTTAVVTRQWILNGRFVMDRSIHSDGQETLALISFDPAIKTYRSWWFNSEGHRNESRGSWDEAARTLAYQTELGDGKSMRSSVRFADKDREVWAFKVTDAEGKVYFNMDIVATRQAAAAGQEAESTDQTRLQGAWGAVTYVQDGQGDGEAPIAPEDSAIRFVFKGDQFAILASGNAGTTPKGSYKLDSRGTTKAIDLIFPLEANATKGQTISGIYEFDGEMLKVCYGLDGAKRPSEFKSTAGSKHVMIVFKRIKERKTQ